MKLGALLNAMHYANRLKIYKSRKISVLPYNKNSAKKFPKYTITFGPSFSISSLYFYREDLENATDRTLTIASSLATILSKTFNTKSQTATALIEKCPSFVSKERKPRIFGRNKKTLQVQGHHFELKQYFHVTYCNQSHIRIWGIAPQGYRCSCKYYTFTFYIR